VKLQSALGRRLPDAYRSFLLWANGGSLFDHAIYLYGYGESLTRSLDLRDAAAISIGWKNELFSLAEPERWENGWTRIGAAVGWDSTYHVELHEDGSCAIAGPAGVHVIRCFDDCLQLLISRVGSCFSCDGVIDKSYAGVEAALASLTRSQ
jgi:hypothetical protein